MSSRFKNALYSIVVVTAVIVVWLLRKTDEPIKIDGKTMGTSYNITYFDSRNRNFKFQVDSILDLINKSISTYDSTSEVSRFNASDRSVKFRLPYFYPPLKVSREVVTASQGSFDPTVMPLVNAWGFGPQKVTSPDTATIEKVKEYIGFEKLNFNKDSVWKIDPRVELDFSGIGQGYGADVITEYLKSKGIKNALIEVGGEGMALGINIRTGKRWRLGIVDPVHPQLFKAYVDLQNKSFSTSGNYFNYRVVNGKRYSHTIDPVSGYPAERLILSATVFASNCTLADAWATAIMSMGHERAIEVIKNYPDLGVCLFYSNETGDVGQYVSDNVKDIIYFQQ